MLRRYKKIVIRFFPRSRIITIVCLVVAVFLGINLIKEIVNRHQIDEKIKQYKADIDKLEQENAEISQLIDSWTTSRQLEREARLKLGLRKPDENVVLIVRDDDRENNSIIDSDAEVLGRVVISESSDDTPNYQKWWQYFFNI